MIIAMNNKLTNIRLLAVILCVGWGVASRAQTTEAGELPARHTLNEKQLEEIRQSAQSGSAVSQFELGEMFEYGRHVTQSDLLAAYWYNRASDQGYSQAQYRLAVLFDNGWGNPVDKEKAFDLYQSAARSGHQLAQHDLAMMYFQGTGTDRNPVQAYKWLKIASLSGNPLMQKHMQLVAQTMSSNDIELAVTLATQWVSQPGI